MILKTHCVSFTDGVVRVTVRLAPVGLLGPDRVFFYRNRSRSIARAVYGVGSTFMVLRRWRSQQTVAVGADYEVSATEIRTGVRTLSVAGVFAPFSESGTPVAVP